jgi:DNA-directed RNA polymerase specialized sigma24 family protein
LSALGAVPDPAADEADRRESEEDARLLASIEEYLVSLPPELNQLHQVRFVRGLSQEAAATELASSRQRIRTLEQRLRDGLRDWLKTKGFLP